MKTRRILLAVMLGLLVMALSSCSQWTIRELPLQKQLQKDVEDYLEGLAGNKVQLFALQIDEREYVEKAGTLDYSGTVRYAWDAFSDENTNQIQAHYDLTDDEWALTSMTSDIDPAALESRVLMRGLLTEAVELPDAVRDALTGANAVLSDTLLGFTAEIDGRVFAFPCPFANFISAGWEVDPATGLDALRTIAPQSYITLPMLSGDVAVSLYVANRTNQTVAIGLGECIGFTAAPGGAPVTLPAAITGQSTAEDVINAYGIPDADEDTGNGRKITYGASESSRVSFLFGQDGAQIDMMDLQARAAAEQAAPLFDTYAFGFQAEGDAFALPATLGNLLEVGWTIAGTAEAADSIRWYETIRLTLTKGDSAMDAVLRNPSLGDLRLDAAEVSAVTLDTARTAAALQGVNGAQVALSPEQTAEDIIAALGQPSTRETAGGSDVLHYNAGDGRYLRVTLGGGALTAQLQSAPADDRGGLNELALRISLLGGSFMLPAVASELQNAGWIPDSGWLQPVQVGRYIEMPLTGADGQTLTAYFENAGMETVNLNDSMIAGLYAGPDDADLTVAYSLHKGSAADEVIALLGTPQYDITDGAQRYLVYGTGINRFLCVRCSGDIADALWIVYFTYQ